MFLFSSTCSICFSPLICVLFPYPLGGSILVHQYCISLWRCVVIKFKLQGVEEKDFSFFYLLFCFYVLLAYLFGNSLFCYFCCVAPLCLCVCVVNSGVKTFAFTLGTLNKVLGNFLGLETCMASHLTDVLVSKSVLNGSKQVTSIEMMSKTEDNKMNIKQLDCKKTELEPKVCAVQS